MASQTSWGSAVDSWQRYTFDVGMPHLAPGGRLSEVECLKVLGSFQWASIADHIGKSSSEISNAQGERLYASFVELEFQLGRSETLASLGEDTRVHVANKVRFFGGKIVDGLMVFGTKVVDDEALAGLCDRAGLARSGRPWVAMTNAFITREGSNTRLRVFRPVVDEGRSLPPMAHPPAGISRQMQVQSGEPLGLPEDTGAGFTLATTVPGPVVYPISPESDLNGAGLLYFARYPAIMAHAERVLLTERLATPVSIPLVGCLSTQHRRLVYFANAPATDAVEVRTTIRVEPTEVGSTTGPLRAPLRLWIESELRRVSDKVLMAQSSCCKTLLVPADAKAVLLEAERWLASLGRTAAV